MPFKIDDCAIPSLWCGNGNPPKRKKGAEKYYSGTGTRYQCMKQGIGAGIHEERRKSLPDSSLQNIKYVGETYETKFRAKGVATLSALRKKANNMTPAGLESFLKKIFTRSSGGLDQRAYNSTLIYLYRNGNSNLPACSKIKP